MKFKVLKFEQNGVECYAGVVDAHELLKHPGFKVDVRDADNPEGYQRDPNPSRCRRIGEYIEEPGSLLPGSVIINLRNKGRFHPEQGCVGTLEIRDDEYFWVVDGQHRLGGFQHTNKPMRIPITIFKSLVKEREMCIFRTINKTQVGISTSLVLDIERSLKEGKGPKARAIELTYELNNRSDSFWYQQINPTGARGMKRPINQASFVAALLKLLEDKWFAAFSLENQYLLLNTYWKGVRKVFPEACANPRNYLLLKTLGVYTMSVYVREVFVRCKDIDGDFSLDTMVKYIMPLKDLGLLYPSEATQYDGAWSSKAEVSQFGGMKGYKHVLDTYFLPQIQSIQLEAAQLKGLK